MYWIPESVRTALRYEKQMQAVAATPVELEDEATEEPWASPSPTAPDMLGRPFPPAEDDGTNWAERLFGQDRSVVDGYHQVASNEGAHHWCRIDGCRHRALVDGDPCPVCKDKGFKTLFDGSDAA